MFTGIIQGRARIKKIDRLSGLQRLTLEFPQGSLSNLEIGASIALQGVCLTVTEYCQHEVYFDVIDETLSVTNLSLLQEGQSINFERSLQFGQEIGGHLLSGHIDCVVEVVAIERSENNCRIKFRYPEAKAKYILKKGYVALDGASLTVAEVDKAALTFEVALIPETLRVTTFGEIRVGDNVNLEVDRQTQVIVETVERVLRERV